MLLRSDDGVATLEVEDAPPERYLATYDVTAPGSGTIVRDLAVMRPYHARVVERQGGEIVGGALSNEEGAFQYVTNSGMRGWQLLQAGPHPATQDFRPIPILRWAAENGFASVRGSDEVLRRRCTIVRTGAPLGSRMARPSDDEHVDLCVDRSGIVLSETWTLGGEVARVTVATALTLEADLEPSVFRARPSVSGAAPGTAGTPLVSSLTPAERSELPFRFEPPFGFRYDGGSSHLRLVNGLVPSTSVVERYTRGIDLLEVTYGTLAGDAEPQGRRRRVGRVEGRLDLHLTYATMTVVGRDRRYIRVRGVDPDVVLAAVEGLRPAGEASSSTD